MAETEQTQNDGPKAPFAIGDEVRLTMTTKANNGVQVPWGATGKVEGVFDASSGHVSVEFLDFDGRPDPDDADGPGATVASVPVAFVELLNPPEPVEARVEDERRDGEDAERRDARKDDAHRG